MNLLFFGLLVLHIHYNEIHVKHIEYYSFIQGDTAYGNIQ